jgi:hypothetical protein
MASKFIWNLDMTIKIRTSKVDRFEIRQSYKEDQVFVDARMGKREAHPIKICASVEEARIFIEELTEAVQ